MKMKRLLLTLAAVTTACVASPVLAADESALAKAKGCFACHTTDKKLVGPAYKDVAKKFEGDAKAADELVGRVLKGSSGVWGPVPMPPNTTVKEEVAKKLVAWILSLK
jgi:cytochrome c